MLKNIHPLLGPKLLKILRAMGHGDEIAIVDANYPAKNNACRLVRLDGCNATGVLDAVLSVLPLDTYVDYPVCTMQVVEKPGDIPAIVGEFHTIIRRRENNPVAFTSAQRMAFYQRVKKSFAVIATGERRLYGNILLTKGVIEPEAG